MTRGLVFGKFYPPHHGHKYLIDTAVAGCDRVTVLVMSHPGETIPGDLRAAWLAEIHPTARIMHTPWHHLIQSWPEEDERSWALFVDFVKHHHPEPIERLFTSEWYGPSTARRLGAEHVAVDPDRRNVPISGTQVRAAPWHYAGFLEPCVRAHYVTRIVVCGAESTGKTTLARALAENYATDWVPEFGREYSDSTGHTAASPHVWRKEEFDTIARVQHEREGAAARGANRLLICDTDPLATEIWQERYLGKRGTFAYPRAALYLLAYPDIPFVQDGTRDGEHVRQWMTGRFEATLESEDLRYIDIRGDFKQRFTRATAAIDALRGHQ